MKLKRVTSCLCAMSILFTMNTTPVFAGQNASDITAMAGVNMLSQEIGELSGTEQQEIDPSVKASIARQRFRTESGNGDEDCTDE